MLLAYGLNKRRNIFLETYVIVAVLFTLSLSLFFSESGLLELIVSVLLSAWLPSADITRPADFDFDLLFTGGNSYRNTRRYVKYVLGKRMIPVHVNFSMKNAMRATKCSVMWFESLDPRIFRALMSIPTMIMRDFVEAIAASIYIPQDKHPHPRESPNYERLTNLESAYLQSEHQARTLRFMKWIIIMIR